MNRSIVFAVTFLTACSATCLAPHAANAAPRAARAANASASAQQQAVAQQAQQWFARGVSAARAGDLAGARRAFALAYSLVPSVDILWNLAATERLSGDAVAAVQHLRSYVASPDARTDRRKLAEDELIPELEATTARLRIDEPEGSIVTVDGAEVARTAVLDVSPGLHAIVVRRDGEESARAINALAGTVTTFSRDASEKSTPVTVAAAPVAPAAAPTPIVVAPLPSTAPAEVVTHAPGRTTTVLALGGVAIVTLATGIVFAIVAREDQADADRLEVKMRDDDRTCKRAGTLCADYESATNAAQRSMLLSSTLIATGGLFGGAALASWILWPTSTTRVVPVAGKDVAGLGVTGRF